MYHPIGTIQLGCDAPVHGWWLGTINIATTHVRQLHVAFIFPAMCIDATHVAKRLIFWESVHNICIV